MALKVDAGRRAGGGRGPGVGEVALAAVVGAQDGEIGRGAGDRAGATRRPRSRTVGLPFDHGDRKRCRRRSGTFAFTVAVPGEAGAVYRPELLDGAGAADARQVNGGCCDIALPNWSNA